MNSIIVEVPVNFSPVSVDDSATTEQDVAVTIDVLFNDTDLDSDVLSVSAVTQGANGIVTNNGVDVNYSPNSGFSGSDSFIYTLSDGNGGNDTAIVSVTVNLAVPPAVAPVMNAIGDQTVVVGNTLTVTITATDANGDVPILTVANLPFGATFVDNGLGSATLSWLTVAGDEGTYSNIIVTASDGALSVIETISIIVNAAAGSSVVSLGAVADTFVRSGTYSNTTYGGKSTLEVRLSSVDWSREAYFKFDLSSESGTVISAKLILEMIKDDGNSTVVEHEVRHITDDSWAETGLTWDTKPPSGVLLDQLLIPGLGSYEFDVTTAIQGELGGLLSLSLTPKSNVTNWIGYASKENADTTIHPRLEITYE